MHCPGNRQKAWHNLHPSITCLCLVVGLTAISQGGEFEVMAGSYWFDGQVDTIVKYNSAGELTDVLPRAGQSNAPQLATNGIDLFVAESVGQARYDINRVAPNGTLHGNVATLEGLSIVSDFEVDDLGNFYATDVSGAAYKYHSDGSLAFQIDSSARRIEVLHDGTTYISDRNELREYSSSGVLQRTIPTGSFFSGDIAVDPTTNLLFHVAEPGDIEVFDLSSPISSLVEEFSVPLGLGLSVEIITTNGNLLITDIGSTIEVDRTGDVVNTYAHDDYGFNSSAVAISGPVGKPFHQELPVGFGGTSVPEPSGWIGLLSAVALIFGRRRS